MENAYSEVPLALAAMFLLVGSGSFIVLSAALFSSRVEGRALGYIDSLSVMPCLATILGFIAGFFAVQDKTTSVRLLFGTDGSIVSMMPLCFGAAVAAISLVYGACLLLGKVSDGVRGCVLPVAAGLGLCFVCSFGAAHVLAPGIPWGAFEVFGQMIGCALASGAALAILIFEKAEALGLACVKIALAVALLIGVSLGVGCFALELIAAVGAAGSVALGPDALQQVSMQVVVGCFCFAALLVFGLMAIYSKEAGFHSVVAVACSFVGVFCVLLAFYSMWAALGA